jgi:hypothetical protein
MYSDQYVQQAHRVYSNRSTAFGRFVFWVIFIPALAGIFFFLVWFIFFKRWQPAT